MTSLLLAVALVLATFNAPGRYGDEARAADLQRLRAPSAIALQEVRDGDPARIKPAGWGHYRPARARSAAVIWDRSRLRAVKRGTYKISSPRAGQPRYVVWVHFRDRATGERIRFGSAHLKALFRSRDLSDRERRAREREHAYQAQRAARWVSGGPFRVLGCDCNAPARDPALRALRAVATPSPMRSTFGRASLDSLWTRSGSWGRTWTRDARGSDHRVLLSGRVDSGA